jgi:SAM-dependent methyltransferase
MHTATDEIRGITEYESWQTKMNLSMQSLAARPDLAAIKARQQVAWSAGDYAVIGTTLQLVGETLCEKLDLRAGQAVLDVAAGNGNATLAAARRGCDVTSTDYVAALLERGRARAGADGLEVRFEQADAEGLPYPNEAFDAVVSTFGVMFTPNQEKAAAELVRVCKRGGSIGLANWTPTGFIGQVFKVLGGYLPPAAGLKSPMLWGTQERLRELFPGLRIDATRMNFAFRYRSPRHWLDTFHTYYGPMNKAFAALDNAKQAGLAEELMALATRMNRGGGSLVVDSEYLEIVIRK